METELSNLETETEETEPSLETETLETEPSQLETEPSNLAVKRGLEESGAPSCPQKKRKHSKQRQEQNMEVEIKKTKKKKKKKVVKGNEGSTSTNASSTGSSQENNSSEEPPKDNAMETVENSEDKGDQETTSQPIAEEKPTDARTDESGYTAALVKKGTASPTGVVGIDCEMVGVGFNGIKSSLARVSVVGGDGRVLLDRYVLPKKRVTDYRTKWSGIRPKHLREEGHDLMKVRREVKALLQNAIVVGHDLKHDFDVLLLNPRQFKIRDTSIYEPFRELMGSHLTPSLKKLTQKVLGVAIQSGEHSSIQDAQAAVQLYNEYSKAWEERLENGDEMAHDIKPEMNMERKLRDMKLAKKKLARKMRLKQKNKKKKVRTKKTHTGRKRI